MRSQALVLALLTAGCTASAPPAKEDPQADQAVARRVDEICALPKAERDAEIERLKKESGLVLHCGAVKD